MLAQYYPGKSRDGFDTRDDRLKWFRYCLRKIYTNWLYESRVNPEIEKSIAVPYGIGCGLARGVWGDYYSLLEEFSKEYNFKVVIYKL